LIRTKLSSRRAAENEEETLQDQFNETTATSQLLHPTIIYWNIEGIKSKNKLFCNDLLKENPSIIYLSETWYDDPIVLSRLSSNYTIKSFPGIRNNVKGRLMMGSILAVRNDIDNFCNI